jgi:hypothetical protein
MQTMAGTPHTKLLIAELILTSVSIITPSLDADLPVGKTKREPDRTKIHHVLCPMVSGLRRVQASLLIHALRKRKNRCEKYHKAVCFFNCC